MFAGIAWRLFGIFRFAKKPDYSEPRSTALWAGRLRGIVSRMWPHPEFRSSATLATTNGYIFHVGLAIIAAGVIVDKACAPARVRAYVAPTHEARP